MSPAVEKILSEDPPLPIPNGLHSVEDEQWHTFPLLSTNMFTCQVIFIVFKNDIHMFFMWIARINTSIQR